MDSMEFNKVIAAVLVPGIAFFLFGSIGVNLVREEPLEKSAIQIAVEKPAAPAAKQAEAALPAIAPLLAKADPAAGEAYAKKVCGICHTFTEGGKAIVGPNLYNVVGGPHAHMQGFDYSNAIKSKTGPWTFAELNEWLHKPSAYAPGTRMGFAGIANDQDRANVIDYLRTLSPNPEPLPNPAEAPAPAAAAPAAPGATAAAPAAPAEPPIAALLASADPAKGEVDTKKVGCVACHTFNEGGKAGLGPNLYGIVGAPHAHMEGFNYSAALKGHEGPWTYDELNKWLTKPAAYAPGTKMTFAGVKDPKERADIIAYLRSLAANPQPLPAE
nr:cytochrome c family protein [uncultured Rhodopila sp.]